MTNEIYRRYTNETLLAFVRGMVWMNLESDGGNLNCSFCLNLSSTSAQVESSPMAGTGLMIVVYVWWACSTLLRLRNRWPSQCV